MFPDNPESKGFKVMINFGKDRRETNALGKLGESDKKIDMAAIDRFSQAAYKLFLDNVAKRKEDSKKKSSLVKEMVSRNRLRYNDGTYNLDLSYITPRVIAMGLPG